MFSRFKKDAVPARTAATTPVNSAPAPVEKPGLPSRLRQPVPTARTPAEALTLEKEKKRKERLMELKLEIHPRTPSILGCTPSGKTSFDSM